MRTGIYQDVSPSIAIFVGTTKIFFGTLLTPKSTAVNNCMRKLRVSDLNRIKISEVINQTYSGPYKDFINVTDKELVIHGVRFKLSSRPIKGLPTQKRIWYVHSHANPHRRCIYLYVDELRKVIGTQDMHGARCDMLVLSNKQRAEYRLTKLTKNRQRLSCKLKKQVEQIGERTLVGRLRQKSWIVGEKYRPKFTVPRPCTH